MLPIPQTPNPYDSPQADVGPPLAGAEPSAARLDPPIQVRGQLNREELDECLQLNAGQNAPPTGFWRWLGIVFLAIQALVGVSFIIEHPWWPVGYLWLPAAVGLLYLAVFVAPSTHERELDKLEREADEVEFVFTTDAFVMNKRDCQIQMAWTALKGFRDSKSLLVLCWDNQTLAVARRWFADERDFSRLVIFLGHKSEMLS